jgi:hypothetical protein
MEYPLEHEVYAVPVLLPHEQKRFRVVPKSGGSGVRATVTLYLDEGWNCTCGKHSTWFPDPKGKILPGCLHIQDAYLFHLNAENRKARMKEQVKEYASVMEDLRAAARVRDALAVEQAKALQAFATKMEKSKPTTGFVVKPKRKIQLEDG